MYPEKPTEPYYDDRYMFVDLDLPSGGYPTRSLPDGAHDFLTIETAMKYKASFTKENFVLAEMQITYNIKPR